MIITRVTGYFRFNKKNNLKWYLLRTWLSNIKIWNNRNNKEMSFFGGVCFLKSKKSFRLIFIYKKNYLNRTDEYWKIKKKDLKFKIIKKNI
jgi:hypothetical protein